MFFLSISLSPSLSFSSLSLCLSEEDRYSRREGGDKCTSLCERREKVRPAVTGAGYTLAAGNLNLNPDRGRSRAVTDPGICIRPGHVKGDDEVERPFVNGRHASARSNLED